MPLTNKNLILAKGFYTSIKSPIMEKHGNLYGNFAVSLDYVLESGIKKDIMTLRKFITGRQLETLLDQLYDNYGNYHLNYIIMFPSYFFDSESKSGKEIYNVEMNRFIMSFNSNILPQHVPFNKNAMYQEFNTIKQIIKAKMFSKQHGEILFVNNNIYSIYLTTGMNLL